MKAPHPKITFSPFKQINNLANPEEQPVIRLSSSRESYRIIGYRDIAPQYKAGFFFCTKEDVQDVARN